MNVLKVILRILAILLAIFVLLFSVATLAGGSILQTILLWLLVVILMYWPGKIREMLGKVLSPVIRLLLAGALLFLAFVVMGPGPKQSIYTGDEARNLIMNEYDHCMEDWPGDTEDIYIQGPYGRVHVLACGDPALPPVVLIHAASMGAHSWAENLEPFRGKYRVYSVDNIGEGNRSQLDDALVYPNSQEDIANHLALVLDSLGVQRSPVLGASNGGYVAMCFALYCPDRVESLLLFGPMGLTPLGGKSLMMLSVASMYPFPFVRDGVARWALGNSENVHRKYGAWFDAIMKGTYPSVAQPVALNVDQKQSISCPVLLFLGEKDPIVGDVDEAMKQAQDYPRIRVVVLDSGHLVAVEHAPEVNGVIAEFLHTESRGSGPDITRP